jgi:hypothetical protein
MEGIARRVCVAWQGCGPASKPARRANSTTGAIRRRLTRDENRGAAGNMPLLPSLLKSLTGEGGGGTLGEEVTTMFSGRAKVIIESELKKPVITR